LPASERGEQRQQTQPVGGAAAFRAERIVDPPPEHLHPAADPEHRALRACAPIATSSARSRSQRRSAVVSLLPGSTIASASTSSSERVTRRTATLGLRGKRVEVGRVRDVRKLDDGEPQPTVRPGVVGPAAQHRRHEVAVLFVDPQLVDPRDHAGARYAEPCFERAQTRFEQRLIAAELGDREGADARALGGLEQRQRSGQRGERAAAIDVGDQQTRRVGGLCHPQVDDVAVAQVDLGR
jgi:hypothetical protein